MDRIRTHSCASCRGGSAARLPAAQPRLLLCLFQRRRLALPPRQAGHVWRDEGHALHSKAHRLHPASERRVRLDGRQRVTSEVAVVCKQALQRLQRTLPRPQQRLRLQCRGVGSGRQAAGQSQRKL